jgi:acetaldehyde dehydrogenase/alcohol dehydrogenase
MVKAAYSSVNQRIVLSVLAIPRPSLYETAHLKMAVSSILLSKSFDNGVICASEQSVLVLEEVYVAVRQEFIDRGAHLLNADEIDAVRKIILVKGSINAKIVGQSAATIAAMAGLTVPEETKVLIGEVESVELDEPFSHEKFVACPGHVPGWKL